MSSEDFSQFSMLDLFRAELATQSEALTAGLLALERNPVAADHLEACMRAAHSLKGAARIIDLAAAVEVAHAMEECLVAAQRGRLMLNRDHIDALLKGVDLLAAIAAGSDEPGDTGEHPADDGRFAGVIAAFLATLDAASNPVSEPPAPAMALTANAPGAEPARAPEPRVEAVDSPPSASGSSGDSMVRVTAESLNRLLGLAGESLMEARRLRPFHDELLRLKRLQNNTVRAFEHLRAALPVTVEEKAALAFDEAQRQLLQSHQFLVARLDELEAIDRRATDLANRLYDETLASRMRPFEDGVRHFSRTIRDLGRSLGKQVRLEIIGGSTSIDRDILEQLEAPLGHLLRNAVDHGVEMPEERIAAGKPAEAVVRVEAWHKAGLLQIVVADDGRGIELEALRAAILARQLTTEATAANLSEAELLEFLFLPGFSMKASVSHVSGRGVGLDAVQAMAKQVRGLVSVASQPGAGTQFRLQLPLTLSVMRTLLVEVDEEPYAFPLTGIIRTLSLAREQIEMLEGRPHFHFDNRQLGLLTTHEVLGRGEPRLDEGDLSVVVVGDRGEAYGLVVDRFLGERELVVRTLDPRLAKVKDISAAALMDDGSPVLILDVADMVRSAEKLAAAGGLRTLERRRSGAAAARRRKRVLVVDDSLTVRELERKLLDYHGYEVEVAVDGMDGWNAVRSDPFDLVVTDIDMPRMDGIELVTLIKKDVRLRSLPVMIVSYKDREEDRARGLDAGADYYLTKGSFHDETLLHAVVDLIGEATE
jgi:two-component system sensor histidine kinase and response regulator WspE